MHPVRAASRVATLRADLASAATAAECVPPLAGLIEIAGELRRKGGEGAENARPVLDEVLEYLRAARGRPSSEDETAAMLYLEAEAGLLRDAKAARSATSITRSGPCGGCRPCFPMTVPSGRKPIPGWRQRCSPARAGQAAASPT